MKDETWEFVLGALAVIVVAIGLTVVLVSALYFASQPNWTQLDCIRVGMQMIDGNCLQRQF